MPQIRSEDTSTAEVLRDGRYHHSALLADPEAAHLAAPIKQRIETLVKARTETEAADAVRQEKQALRDRAEYLHDDLHRACELEVLGLVKKNRAATAYRQTYRQGFSGLIALSGEEQEREVKEMVKGLEAAFPDLGKKYKKDLLKRAADAAAAARALAEAETGAAHAFAAEVLCRGELARQMRRNEGALLSLFPDDKALVRLYFRNRRRPAKDEPTPAPSPT